MANTPLKTTVEIAGVLSPSLQKSIQEAVDRLDAMSQETLDSAGAAAKLSAEIKAQEDVLRNLQRGYEDFVVSGKESSDAAKQVADQIQSLSGDLTENRETLDAAYKAAQNSQAANRMQKTHTASWKNRYPSRTANSLLFAASTPTSLLNREKALTKHNGWPEKSVLFPGSWDRTNRSSGTPNRQRNSWVIRLKMLPSRQKDFPMDIQYSKISLRTLPLMP